MKLTTIWTSGYPMAEKLHRTQEWAMQKIAHHLPRRLAYWSFIDSGVRYMPPDREVPAIGYTEVLQRFGREEHVA